MRPLLVTPAIIDAYRANASGPAGPAASSAPVAAGDSFGDLVSRAMETAVQETRAADTASTQAMTGQTGATEVVLAVTKAELALQTAVALRDRVIAAYQDIMRMPI